MCELRSVIDPWYMEILRKMFPPYPIPGFVPNFTGYDLDQYDIDWYSVYEAVAQPPQEALLVVSFSLDYKQLQSFS